MTTIDTIDKAAALSGQTGSSENYWLEKLAEIPGKAIFPYDYKRTGSKDGKKEIESLKNQFTGTLYSQLMKLSNNSMPRLQMILTASVISLLAKYSGKNDILIGTPIFKQEKDAKFINTVLPLRNRLHAQITFKEMLLQVRKTLLEADENQNYPIEMILQKHKIPYSRGDDFPLFDVTVLLEEIQDKAYISHISTNMRFVFSTQSERVNSKIEYDPALYERETPVRIAAHFRRFLEQALFAIDTPLAEIEILSRKEKQNLLEEINDTKTAAPTETTILQSILRQVEKTPHKIALMQPESGGQEAETSLTYRQMEQAAHRQAVLLQTKGVTPGTIVAIMAEPAIETVTAILGILKTGAAYLPIDPQTPEHRLAYVLADSTAGVLLVQDKLLQDELTANKG
ncbi:MAG: AMP-binding protein, partial [bacterium]|nr:AMP-binding protein [bacterium]